MMMDMARFTLLPRIDRAIAERRLMLELDMCADSKDYLDAGISRFGLLRDIVDCYYSGIWAY